MSINFIGKAWGGHIVPTPTQCAGVAAAWTNLLKDWRDNVAGSNWTDWVKPQIDAAVIAGCNFIGLIGCMDGVHSGAITQSAVNACLAQLANYCQSIGLAFYWKPCGFNQMTGVTNAEAATYVLSTLNAMNGLVTIIGVDIVCEANAWDDGGGIRTQAVADRCNAIYTLVKAGTSLPCTYSITDEWNGDDCRNWAARIAASMDYLDFHPYTANGWATPLATANANYWNTTYSRDIIFGEGGSPQSDSVAQQDAFANGLGFLMNGTIPTGLRGWCIWSIADQSASPSSQCGMFDNSFVARANKVQTFQRYSLAHVGHRGASGAGGLPVFGG